MDRTGVSAAFGGCVSKRVVELDAVRQTPLFAFTIADIDADRRGSRIVLRETDY